MNRYLAPLPRRPGGNAWPSRSSVWTPSVLGSALVFEALAENATLSGSNITSLANPHGTAGAMTPFSSSTYCTLDTSVLQGGKAAIRTNSTASDMRVLTGGPTGSSAFSVYALTQIVAQKSAGGDQDSNYFTLGNPGNDATHKPYGLGATVVSNGAWERAGGFQNTSLVGSTSFPLLAFNANLRLRKLSSSGSLVTIGADGGKLASLATAVTLDNSGRLGFSGPYPLAAYGPPPSLTYGMWAVNRELTAAEEAHLLAHVARVFSYTPAMFISTVGDSRTAGHVTNSNTTSFGELMVSQYGAASRTVYLKNDGVTSQSTKTIRARVEAAGFFDYFAPAGFRRQVMIIRGRTNDPAATPAIGYAESYANLAAISTLAQSYGVKTIISTEHGTTNYTSGDRTELANFNALVLANSAGADGVADIRDLIANYATTNPTLTDMPSDGVHQSDALLALEAARYRAAVDLIP